jgi:hypothetical protein
MNTGIACCLHDSLQKNNLLMYPDPHQPFRSECEDMAAYEGARNDWELASRYSARLRMEHWLSAGLISG